MRRSSVASRSDCLVCPRCEVDQLYPSDRDSMHCQSCGSRLQEALLETLRCISTLPETLGSHACECGHPEMRLLPDDTFHCPACGSEVLPIGAPLVDWKSGEHGEAYWCGWLDGRYRELSSFVDNPNLAKWETPSERLAYYQGHRAGREVRRGVIGGIPDARETLFG